MQVFPIETAPKDQVIVITRIIPGEIPSIKYEGLGRWREANKKYNKPGRFIRLHGDNRSDEATHWRPVDVL